MTLPTSLVTRLVELWGRLEEPEAQDLVRTLRLARQLEDEPDTPGAVLSIAWALVEAEHEAAGWEVHPSAHSPRCIAAAEAARQSWAEVGETVQVEVGQPPGEVLLLGLPPTSRVLFGAWDLLPSDGLELVLLGETGPARKVYSDAGTSIRIRPAADLTDLFEAHSTPVELGSCAVRVPTTPLLAALAAPGAHTTADTDTLVFVAAASELAETRRWSTVEQIADRLGSGRAPRLAASRLDLEEQLRLERKGVARLTHALTRLLRG